MTDLFSVALDKQGLLIKLTPYGITTDSAIDRLRRIQGLPFKALSPRKFFYDEDEVDVWLARRYPDVAKANANKAKVAKKQRERNKLMASVDTSPAPEAEIEAKVKAKPAITPFKANEA